MSLIRFENYLLKGFSFGMLLQFSIGPMCLMVFNTASTKGLLSSIPLVIAIALVDGIFIILAAMGVTALLKKKSVQIVITILGSIILIAFGLNMVFTTFEKSLLPEVNLFSKLKLQSLFLQGIVLTASNPLTILFWGGVFTMKVTDENLNNKQLTQFGAGCILSTISFLFIVAVAGSLIGAFMTTGIISVLNVAVGVVVCYFGIKLLYKKFHVIQNM